MRLEGVPSASTGSPTPARGGRVDPTPTRPPHQQGASASARTCVKLRHPARRPGSPHQRGTGASALTQLSPPTPARRADTSVPCRPAHVPGASTGTPTAAEGGCVDPTALASLSGRGRPTDVDRPPAEAPWQDELLLSAAGAAALSTITIYELRSFSSEGSAAAPPECPIPLMSHTQTQRFGPPLRGGL